MSTVKRTSFKGMSLFQIYRTPEDMYPFQMGVRKAQLVLDHIDELKKFVEDNQGTPDEELTFP